MKIRHYVLSFSKKCREIIRWVRVVYIMALSHFSCVLSKHTIHNKSYYSPLSSERGWWRGLFSLWFLRIRIVGEAIPLFSFFALALWERLFHSTKRKGRNQIPPLRLLHFVELSFHLSSNIFAQSIADIRDARAYIHDVNIATCFADSLDSVNQFGCDRLHFLLLFLR